MSIETKTQTKAQKERNLFRKASGATLHQPVVLGERSRPKANTHYLYDEYFDLWHLAQDSIDGGEKYVERHLFPHRREPVQAYESRVQKAVFADHADKIQKVYTSHVYKAKIARTADKTTDETLAKFWEDIDGAGHSADIFFRRVFAAAYVFGHAFVQVRLTGGKKDAASLGEQLETGMAPRARLVTPLNVLDWELDENHQFEWAIVRERATKARTFETKSTPNDWHYRLWTKEDWTLFNLVETEKTEDKEATLSYQQVESGTHPLGKVPLLAVYIGDRDRNNQPVSKPPMKNIFPHIRRLVNLGTLIDEQIYQHVFNILQVPMSIYKHLVGVDFSVGGTLPVPNDSQGYSYLAPDVSQLEVLQTQIDKTENLINTLSGLRSADDSKRAQSGEALAFINIDKNALVQSLARQMQQCETNVANCALAWFDKEADVTVQYTVELEPGEVENALRDALTFESLGLTGKARIENQIQVTRSHLGRYLNQTDLEEVLEDIRQRETGNASPTDVYHLTNAARLDLIAPTAEVIAAAHIATGVPLPEQFINDAQASFIADKKAQAVELVEETPDRTE